MVDAMTTDLIDRKKAAKADWLRALQASARVGADPDLILPRAFDRVARDHGPRIALLGETETMTFDQLADRSNRYARWALANGLDVGDVVGLMMDNRPEHVAIWLGLTRVGVIVALVNTKLVGPVLARCLTLSGARYVIAAADLAVVCDEAVRLCAAPPRLMVCGETPIGGRMDLEIAATSGVQLAIEEQRAVTQRHHALYIFTSGTTGMPKAAIVSHRRVMHWASWFNALADAKSADRMYHCLPMYHALGAVVAVWTTLLGGGSVAIRERFSTRHFWSELASLDCTMVQYIGEMCRYLVNAAPDPAERRHRLRLALGNGMRADVWQRFTTRFAIPRVLEFYAATESNFSLYNLEGEPGAIGRMPPFLAAGKDMALVRFDLEAGRPARFDDGFCRIAGIDEPGEAIARIKTTEARDNAVFEGYLDAAATDAKVLRNVFTIGDAWMRSGDLMRQDARGFYYFVDRIGDTFRWKGENVATSEVAEVVLSADGILDALVCGIAVPGHDGRAGMATLVVADGFDLDRFKQHIDARLPAYARPLFVEIKASIDLTDTFKYSRRNPDLGQLDPDAIGAPLFVIDRAENRYIAVDAQIHRSLLAGRRTL